MGDTRAQEKKSKAEEIQFTEVATDLERRGLQVLPGTLDFRDAKTSACTIPHPFFPRTMLEIQLQKIYWRKQFAVVDL